jgi:succinate-semialdehyde dehydrogenase/glutarate-semialdehyde dehydrogenase
MIKREGDPVLQFGLFVNGQWVKAEENRIFDVLNPATGDVVGRVADASPEDVKKAIDAAAQAFPGWSSRTANERADILRRTYELMLSRQDELAEVMTREQGKPIGEARGEVAYGAEFLLWYAEEAKRIYGETIPASHPGKRLFAVRQPVGVVAAITPWNFPAAMITRKIAPALAAGCTVIVKPAEQTPLTACLLMEIFREAGLPDGAVNLVTGSNPRVIGDVLLGDSRVRKVTFTGSTEVGKEIMRKAADTVKRISLELGGQAPLIVFEDADLELTAEQALASKFRNAGQTCICTNRIYVQESVLDDFVGLFTDKVKKLRVGNGLERGTDIGPLIDAQAVAKVETHIADAVAKGARCVLGGRKLDELGPHFFEPTVLVGVTPDMKVEQEETFGPVAPIRPFRDEREAISMANGTRYGLAAYVYTRDLARAIRVSEALEFGIVGINDGIPSTPQAPFGGMKESGIGREGGRQGIEEFLETKYISVGGI